MADDFYQTIGCESAAELREKGSRFIARAVPVHSKSEAEGVIEKIRKEHFDATHNCYAYCIGVNADRLTRQSDDGEPSGTAGKPILQAITSRSLTDILIVITRYFGGTKLGIGGLIRAYGRAAALALERADIVSEFLTETIALDFSYKNVDIVMAQIDKFQATIVQSKYDSSISLLVRLRKSLVNGFLEQLVDRSAGRIHSHIVI